MTADYKRGFVCDTCRKPTARGRRYCGDHRDPRPLPDRVELVRWVEAQQCPICRDGRTFRVLANHTAKAHGIFGDEIRAAAGLTYAAQICSEEHSEDARIAQAAIPEGRRNLTLGQSASAKAKNGRRIGAQMRAFKALAARHASEFDDLYAAELEAQP